MLMKLIDWHIKLEPLKHIHSFTAMRYSGPFYKKQVIGVLMLKKVTREKNRITLWICPWLAFCLIILEEHP